MVNLKKTVCQFFQEHQSLLQETYPGLHEQRLLREVRDLFLFGFKNSQEFFSQAYLPHFKNPITQFFDQLRQGVPLAYIFGKTYFYGYPFMVAPGIFIPRLETEILVEMAKREMQRLKSHLKNDDEILKVADLGTGSGSILLTTLIGQKQKCRGYGLDICEKALSVAKNNAYALRYMIHPQTEVHFYQADRFHNFHEQLHMIITNPPYIKRNEDREQVHWAVHKNEPHTALYLDDEKYLPWFKILFERSLNLLYKGGVLLMEGHEHHLAELKSLAESIGFSQVECKEDLTGRVRFLQAYKL